MNSHINQDLISLQLLSWSSVDFLLKVYPLLSCFTFHFLPLCVCSCHLFFRVHLSFIRSLAHVYLSASLVVPLFGPCALPVFLICPFGLVFASDFPFACLFISCFLGFGLWLPALKFNFFFLLLACLCLSGIWVPFDLKKKTKKKAAYKSAEQTCPSQISGTFKTLTVVLNYRQHISSFICQMFRLSLSLRMLTSHTGGVFQSDHGYICKQPLRANPVLHPPPELVPPLLVKHLLEFVIVIGWKKYTILNNLWDWLKNTKLQLSWMPSEPLGHHYFGRNSEN